MPGPTRDPTFFGKFLTAGDAVAGPISVAQSALFTYRQAALRERHSSSSTRLRKRPSRRPLGNWKLGFIQTACQMRFDPFRQVICVSLAGLNRIGNWKKRWRRPRLADAEWSNPNPGMVSPYDRSILPRDPPYYLSNLNLSATPRTPSILYRSRRRQKTPPFWTGLPLR